MKVLFVGNSHTYNNEIPLIFMQLAEKEGIKVQAIMNAHGGWTLFQHSKEPDVPFNILHGGFDYVVFQEHAHPFDYDGNMMKACETMGQWCKQANATPVFFMTWAQKWERHLQEPMTEGYRKAAELTGGLLAPAGERFWQELDAHPETELFSPDGGHSSYAGSYLAAEVIWQTIRDHYLANKKQNI